MEAELIRENIITSCPSANLKLNITAEGETIVPDSKNDISKILFTESRCCIEKTEVQNGRVIFTGNAEFTVLYVPESGCIISSVTSKVPFNHIEECESITSEDKYTLTAKPIHAECTLLNSRKISLKTIIRADFTSYTDVSVPVVSKIRNSDMETKVSKEAFTHMVSAYRESFTVSDFLDIPASEPPIDTLLLCRTKINDCSVKTVTGKAVVKGSISVFSLYLTAEGNISHMTHDLPFTEILDVPGLSEDAVCDINFFIRDYSVKEDINDSSGGLMFSSDICLSVAVFETYYVYVTEDAYIPGTYVNVTYSNYKKSLIKEQTTLSLTLKESVEIPKNMPPMGQLYPVSSEISSLDFIKENGKIKIKGSVDVSVFYLSADGKAVNTFLHEITFTEEAECPSKDCDVRINGEITHSDYNFINQTKLDLRCLLTIHTTFSENTDTFPCISSVELGEVITNKRPSIIIYFVKSGDTLWNIAKKYHTTVDKILSANALEKGDFLNSGLRLLIPS